MSAGMLVNLNVPYTNKPGDAQVQAEEILKKAQQLLKGGTKGVTIIYSANYGQTRKIERVYFAGGWDTQTDGEHQAEVMREMESLLGTAPYRGLQGTMRIAPITTMNAYPGDDPVSPWNTDVLMGIVITDLDRVRNYLEGGWDVIGWQNQQTVDDLKNPYAVGGGVTKLPQAVSDQIQSTLTTYAKQYRGT